MAAQRADGGASADTSVNSKKVPAAFTMALRKGLFKPGHDVLDYGCGRWPGNARAAVEGAGANYFFWDPAWFPDWGEARGRHFDTVVLSNVLNVIPAKNGRLRAVSGAWGLLKPGGRLIITVYEADGSGASGPSKPGCWQERRRLSSYVMDELGTRRGETVCGGKMWVSAPKRIGDWSIDHFSDGMIDFRCNPEFSLWVAVNIDGEALSASYVDGRFSPEDLEEAYRKLWRPGWNMESEAAAYAANFRAWIDCKGMPLDMRPAAW